MRIATDITVSDLPHGQVAALCQKAERLGLSPERYVRQLIETDLELDQTAAATSFGELAKPFEKALKGMSVVKLDGLARRQPRKIAR